MKYIKYYFNTPINTGTKESPEWGDELHLKAIPYSESGLEIAEKEAHNGEYTIEDDGQPEPKPTQEERIAELEEMLNALLGVSE